MKLNDMDRRTDSGREFTICWRKSPERFDPLGWSRKHTAVVVRTRKTEYGDTKGSEIVLDKNMKKNEKYLLIISWICLIFLSLFLSSCYPGMMDQIFAPRPKGEIKYDCSPRADDPEGYVVKVCEYLNENQIWVGRNAGLVVSQVIETEIDGREVIILQFACCGTGDSASIDKETGEVLGYSLGIY